MAEIAAKYSLFAFMPVTYTLTGNDRQGKFTFDDTHPDLNVKAKNGLGVQDYGVNAVFENTFTIIRARIVPRGAAGLLASPNTMAGEFYLNVGVDDNGLFKIADSIYMQFTEWGEWEYINKVIRPYKNMGLIDPKPGNVSFQMDMITGKFFTCDDFNIQSDFVGQGVQAMLELDVETAGMVDNTSKAIF